MDRERVRSQNRPPLVAFGLAFDWDADNKGGSLAFHAVKSDAPAMLFDAYGMRDRKPLARSFPDAFCCEKRRKYLRANFLWDSRAGVLNANLGPVAIAAGADCDAPFISAVLFLHVADCVRQLLLR